MLLLKSVSRHAVAMVSIGAPDTVIICLFILRFFFFFFMVCVFVCVLILQDAFVSAFFFFKQYHEYQNWADKGMAHIFEQFQQPMGAEESPIGCGDYYSYYKDMLRLLQKIGLSGDMLGVTPSGQKPRGFLTFYEEMHANFDTEVQRLATFLGVVLTREKLASLKERVSFRSMAGAETSGGQQHFKRKHYTIRKGVVGDYQNHLSAGHWTRADRLFREQMLTEDQFRPLFRIMNVHNERRQRAKL